MDSFSWSDSIQAAFSSCLPCLRPASPDPGSHNGTPHENDGVNRVRRARPDELEGLLADVADTDTEAETMSLHSNIGAGERRHKKRRGLTKRITLFGWNLFGKPPVQLSEDDEEDELLSRRRRRTPMTISSSTLDSDAAQLESSAIEDMSASQLEERARTAEEEENRRKEERRRWKRERKELKLAAQALAFGGADEGFEGFPGSGQGYPDIPSPFQHSSGPVDARDDFGPFVGGNGDAVDADADAADLGGELYTRKATSGGSNGSDSRSRTSLSNPDTPVHYNHHYISQLSPHMVPLPPSSHGQSDSSSLQNPSAALGEVPRRKKKSTKAKSSNKSSSSTSQSVSLPSPVQTQMPFVPSPEVASPQSPSLHTGPERLLPVRFEGYPEDSSQHGFPSPGLGGARSKNRDMGAFLAHRGDA